MGNTKRNMFLRWLVSGGLGITTSSDSAPEFFHSAEAQECFALYQYGYAEASDQASYWKPLE
ncbi:hypothetical protein BPORC_1648 [Bifidobacterium porcinum]|nr:hypothetical protein BPORC_1648 [Bifidobacterium porcinum]